MSSFRPDRELSKICEELWEADENRLTPGKDYQIDLQGGTKAYWRGDKAEDPLFSWVRDDVLKRPTFQRFIALLDNYESETGRTEEVTSHEIQENRAFIDAICETKVMDYAHRYLASKGKSSRNTRDFKHQLYDLWFKLYRRTRGSGLDSSAFEHVFVGETRTSSKGKREVLGFHNWIQFYLQEKDGKVDYQGYIIGKRPELADKSHLVTIKFNWNKEVKPMGSSFIGTSPEFEVALYTICFLCGKEGDTTDEISFAGYDIIVTCYKHGLNLGTSFPKEAQ